MGSDEPRKPKTRTVTKEYGQFIRTKTRYGKRRKQKTTRIKPNPEKVTLGKLGSLEFYAYPDQYPDKVFFGLYPLSDFIEEPRVEDILRIYNKVKWYFAEYWQKSGRTTKGAKSSRQAILRSINAGLDKRKERAESRDSLN